MGPSAATDENGRARHAGFPKVTPRQAQVLDLAATGLSDKEIARRLHVTHRTIRTHFEKLYHDGSFRNRSQAVASWTSRPEAGHKRPSDECPYPKPFPPGFTECPAFQATQMIALDISYRPIGMLLSCRQLESRLMPNTDYRWYGACVIGDAEARRRWSNEVGADRLHEIGTLRQEVSVLSGPYVQRIWELKRLPQDDPEISRATQRQMEATLDQFMTQMRRVLAARSAALERLHLPLEACLRLIRIAIERFVDQGLSEAEWEVPEELLDLFPEDVRSYFRPRQTARQLDETPPAPSS